jgi:ribA/ribD-fused uncharacterized protein
MVIYFKNDSPLSNYYLCNVTLANGLTFSSSEAAYHSQKFFSYADKKLFCDLLPDESKKLSRKLVSKIDVQWFDQNKYALMYECVYCKMLQNSDCRQYLLQTGDNFLVEDTTGWCDNIWGNCNCPKCCNTQGRNLLGIILMQVRSDLRGKYF